MFFFLFFLSMQTAPREGLSFSPKICCHHLQSPKYLPYNHPKTPTSNLPSRLKKNPWKSVLHGLLSRNLLKEKRLNTPHQGWIEKSREGVLKNFLYKKIEGRAESRRKKSIMSLLSKVKHLSNIYKLKSLIENT